jgi:hypothetical protein
LSSAVAGRWLALRSRLLTAATAAMVVQVTSGRVGSGRITQTVKHPPFVYIFSFFGNNLLCNRQYIYQYRNGIQPMILFLPPLKLNLSVYLRPCAIFVHGLFFGALL